MKQNEPDLSIDSSKKTGIGRKKATVREIARLVGCAHCTVSRALANESSVATEMRTAILKTARELGYSGKKTKNIALIIPQFGREVCYYNTRLIQALSEVLDGEGVPFELIPENRLCDFNEKIIDGAISLCYSGETAKKWFECNPIPLVCVNDFGFHTDRIYSVASNDELAMRQIMTHLKKHGHRKAGCYTTTPPKNLNHSRRRKFFRDYAEAVFIQPFFYAREKKVDSEIEKMLTDGITALICPFEMTDLSLYTKLKAAGKRIPEDLELICWQVPGITENLRFSTMRLQQDFDRLASESILLLKQLMDGKRKANDILVDYRISEGF